MRLFTAKGKRSGFLSMSLLTSPPMIKDIGILVHPFKKEKEISWQIFVICGKREERNQDTEAE